MICDPEKLQTDFFLLREGPILVMSDQDLFRAGTQWLQKNRGYKAHKWNLNSEAEFYQEVSKTLCWEQQFGYPSWNGNFNALSDGLANWPVSDAERILISLDNAERLKMWFGKNTEHFWDIFQEAARMQLLFGVGLLVMVNTSSEGEASLWAKAARVCKLTRKGFPGAELYKNAT